MSNILPFLKPASRTFDDEATKGWVRPLMRLAPSFVRSNRPSSEKSLRIALLKQPLGANATTAVLKNIALAAIGRI